jgi:hypothetical protein
MWLCSINKDETPGGDAGAAVLQVADDAMVMHAPAQAQTG